MVVPIIGSSPGNTTTSTTTSSNIAPDEDIECLWRKVVKGDNSDNGDNTKTKTTTIKTKRAKHKYKPTYTKRQQNQLLVMLDELINEFSITRKDLVVVLEFYRDDIANNMMTVEEEVEE